MDSSQDKFILDALNEDLRSNGDITSEGLIPKDQCSMFKLVVNEDAIVAGLEVFKRAFTLVEKTINIKSFFRDGEQIRKDQVIVNVYGNTQAILKSERTALNFISHLSGIATSTNQLFKLIEHTGVVLLDTRKTTPGLRIFEKQAVIAGGGKNHRFNLGEMVLIKDNHVKTAGGITQAVKKIRELYGNKYKIEIEVENSSELKEAIFSKPDIIMFDNWKLQDLKGALKLVPSTIMTEASGQITKENIRNYAEAGVNYISTSYMIKNSKWIDFSLNAV